MSKKRSKPEPLTTPAHPIKFTKNLIHQLAANFLFVYIGVLIIAAVYYLLFETTGFMKDHWHQLVSDDSLRHSIRNVAEGLLGGLLGQAVIWNHFKLKEKKAQKYEKEDLTPFRLGITPFLVIIAAVPGFLLARWGVNHLNSVMDNLTQTKLNYNAALLERMKQNISAGLDEKLMGFGAAFVFGRWPAKPVFDDLQRGFIEYRICNGKGVPNIYPPSYRARYNYIKARGVRNREDAWLVTTFRVTLVVGLLLAAFGWYVLNFIAYGKAL